MNTLSKRSYLDAWNLLILFTNHPTYTLKHPQKTIDVCMFLIKWKMHGVCFPNIFAKCETGLI